MFMKTKTYRLFMLVPFLFLLTSCDVLHRIEDRAKQVNNYEAVALTLAKDNRKLRIEIGHLSFKIQALEAKNNYLQIKLDKKNQNRQVAAVAPPKDVKNDLVKFNIYKWNENKLLYIGDTEFSKQNFERSAQFYSTLFREFPKSGNISDQVLFKAGIAAYKSKVHYNWSLEYLSRLTLEYPTSKFFRGAKLWIALSHMQRGNQGKFFEVVEEFRKKYRNTPEWEILRGHYDEFRQKLKNKSNKKSKKKG